MNTYVKNQAAVNKRMICRPLLLAGSVLFLIAFTGAAPANTSSALLQEAYVKASNTGSDLFGTGVAISGNTMVIGAAAEASNATGVNGDQGNDLAPSAGAVYVYVRNGSGWSQQAYLKASNTDVGDQFGTAVDIDGDTLVVGAPFEASASTGVDGNQDDNSAVNAGAAYVFVRNNGSWSQQTYLKASNTDEDDQFGSSVAISGDTIVIGAHLEDSADEPGDNSNLDSGAAYVFHRNNGSWTQQAMLKASNTESLDEFGFRVALDGDSIVVGAEGEDSAAADIDGDENDNSTPLAGAAYVFVRSGSNWMQQAYLKASNAGANDRFGASVAISGNTAVVGASNESSNATGVNGNEGNNSSTGAGAAYVFVRNGNVWSQQAYLKASNTQSLDVFGHAVAIFGDALVVSAFSEDSNATGIDGDQGNDAASFAGAVYLFTRSGSTWSQKHYLKASNTEPNDTFGESVDITADTVVVGANGEDSSATGINGNQNNNGVQNAGAVYVFLGDLAGNGSALAINAGLNDAWFNPATAGQGLFITVFPNIEQIFLAWFTYDTERPPGNVQATLGEPGHRWLTAFGPYSGGTAILDIEITSGGVFDMGQPMPTQESDGAIMLEFSDCNSGLVSYDIESVNVQGEFPIERIALDNVPRCEALATQ